MIYCDFNFRHIRYDSFHFTDSSPSPPLPPPPPDDLYQSPPSHPVPADDIMPPPPDSFYDIPPTMMGSQLPPPPPPGELGNQGIMSQVIFKGTQTANIVSFCLRVKTNFMTV